MKTILVVDDDPTFADLVRSSLDKNEYTIRAAPDGLKGLESVKEVSPDMILLDVKMPNMGGVEFLKQLNAVERDKKIPVLITSNDSSLDTISQGTELGIQGYILKSNESLHTIVDTIKRVFADHENGTAH